jgi:TRAP-type C4-dicarboxylate transport system substrate-binding protein
MRYAILFLVLALCAAGDSAAQEPVLKFATVSPPQSRIATQFLHPWAQKIADQGKGALKLEVYDGQTIANLGNIFDRVQSDVAQIGWGLTTNVAGHFPRTDAGSLPFVGENAEQSSAAFWRMYKKGVLDAEYGDTQPLILAYLTQAGLHMRKPITTLEDPNAPLQGLKIIASGWGTGQAVTKLGAAPIVVPLSDMYESLNRGTVDGAVVSWTSFNPFKLAEVTNFHVDTTLGTAPGFVFMAKKKYLSLPAEARTVLDANSGEAQSRSFGAWWDNEKNFGRKEVQDRNDPGRTIVQLRPEQLALWKKKTETIHEEWARNAPDGEKVLAAFKAELAQVKSGM